MKTISQKIRERRNELGLTQSALAELVDLSPRSIFGYEAGEKMPRPSTVKKLAEALRVTPKYLTDDSIDTPLEVVAEKYVNEAVAHYGEQGGRDMHALLSDNIALFAGGDISQSEKDTFFEAVMRAYIKCKDESASRSAENANTGEDK